MAIDEKNENKSGILGITNIDECVQCGAVGLWRRYVRSTECHSGCMRFSCKASGFNHNKCWTQKFHCVVSF